MERKIKVNYNGQMVDATPVDVIHQEEFWNAYSLDDGTTLKFKAVVTKIVRVDGVYDAEGNPLYLVQSQNIARADAPDSQRKK